MGILSSSDDHQMWPQNWPHYVWASLCQIPFLRTPSIIHLFDFLTSEKYCVPPHLDPTTIPMSHLVKVSLPNIYSLERKTKWTKDSSKLHGNWYIIWVDPYFLLEKNWHYFLGFSVDISLVVQKNQVKFLLTKSEQNDREILQGYDKVTFCWCLIFNL